MAKNLNFNFNTAILGIITLLFAAPVHAEEYSSATRIANPTISQYYSGPSLTRSRMAYVNVPAVNYPVYSSSRGRRNPLAEAIKEVTAQADYAAEQRYSRTMPSKSAAAFAAEQRRLAKQGNGKYQAPPVMIAKAPSSSSSSSNGTVMAIMAPPPPPPPPAPSGSSSAAGIPAN